MASLRTQSAARMLRTVASPRIAVAAAPRRLQSTTVTAASGTVPAPVTNNEPDYKIQADKATSYELSTCLYIMVKQLTTG